jgi:hypothetical protein
MDDLLSNLVESIEDLATEAAEYKYTFETPEEVKFNELPYLRTGARVTALREASADSINVHSLQGLVDYVAAKFSAGGEEFPHGLAVHVVAPREVRLVSASFGPWRQRDVYAVAQPSAGARFPFGKFLDQEMFQINLLSMFSSEEDRAKLLDFSGNIRGEDTSTSRDDGVSQIVTTRKTVTTDGVVKVENPFTLVPYRTFAEIVQPPQLVVFRIATDGSKECALFEVDDGQWQLKAIDGIKAYLAEQLPDVPIIG